MTFVNRVTLSSLRVMSLTFFNNCNGIEVINNTSKCVSCMIFTQIDTDEKTSSPHKIKTESFSFVPHPNNTFSLFFSLRSTLNNMKNIFSEDDDISK
jgi:hypothetical protein